MSQSIHDVIIELMISYSTKESTPTPAEILSIENALPFVAEHLEPATYRSYVEWVERNKERYQDDLLI
ncbi:hypothetical protein [Cohnella terricola]|uniref:Uncharacterized protein n=1 Tax=Cohnella terricola TaxID=1289167 RepID=A0A559JDN8_9BACL|nr:hypothetical protein [Cohnella terricola]TVX97979.1 hypothetical protein FPZ45_17190 [Cohnella terricola]